MFKSVDLWSFPTEQLHSETDLVCEMSDYDHAFLCGMIKHRNPRKLLEIGIAEGGTTAVIVKCLSLLGDKREVYSVDLSRTLYCDEQKKTGYEYDRIMPYINRTNISHKILLGETIAKQIEEIGSGIDFVVIDTTHQVPGEILDFLCVFPYLTKDATVILHDINLNYIKAISGNRSRVIDSVKSVSTKLLFSVVTANKYLPVAGDRLSNIAAFTVSGQTYEHIEDIFYLLSFTWAYVPKKSILDDYRNIYKDHYDRHCLELYDISIANNRKIFNRMELANCIQEEDLNKYRFPYEVIPDGSKIVLYAAGTIGKEVYQTQKCLNKYKIVMWVDKKYKECIEKGLKVVKPSNMTTAEFDYVVVAVESEDMFQSIYYDILSNGWDAGKPVIGPISQY